MFTTWPSALLPGKNRRAAVSPIMATFCASSRSASLKSRPSMSGILNVEKYPESTMLQFG
jgi:hypothetical protein